MQYPFQVGRLLKDEGFGILLGTGGKVSAGNAVPWLGCPASRFLERPAGGFRGKIKPIFSVFFYDGSSELSSAWTLVSPLKGIGSDKQVVKARHFLKLRSLNVTNCE